MKNYIIDNTQTRPAKKAAAQESRPIITFRAVATGLCGAAALWGASQFVTYKHEPIRMIGDQSSVPLVSKNVIAVSQSASTTLQAPPSAEEVKVEEASLYEEPPADKEKRRHRHGPVNLHALFAGEPLVDAALVNRVQIDVGLYAAILEIQPNLASASECVVQGHGGIGQGMTTSSRNCLYDTALMFRAAATDAAIVQVNDMMLAEKAAPPTWDKVTEYPRIRVTLDVNVGNPAGYVESRKTVKAVCVSDDPVASPHETPRRYPTYTCSLKT